MKAVLLSTVQEKDRPRRSAQPLLRPGCIYFFEHFNKDAEEFLSPTCSRKLSTHRVALSSGFDTDWSYDND